MITPTNFTWDTLVTKHMHFRGQIPAFPNAIRPNAHTHTRARACMLHTDKEILVNVDHRNHMPDKFHRMLWHKMPKRWVKVSKMAQ